MQTHGLPNDMLPLLVTSGTIIVVIPLMQTWVYPWLTKKSIPFGPILRMTIGFTLIASSMAYAAGLQSIIYHSGPCYERPLRCVVDGSTAKPNSPDVALQIPIFVVQGIADILCFVSATEYAHKKAPKTMKSFIQAVYISTGAIGGLLGIAASPAARDPHQTAMYSTIAAVMFVTTLLFWLAFRNTDKSDHEDACDNNELVDASSRSNETVAGEVPETRCRET
jgi:POT family proton-dependent oligopeptide transporter